MLDGSIQVPPTPPQLAVLDDNHVQLLVVLQIMEPGKLLKVDVNSSIANALPPVHPSSLSFSESVEGICTVAKRKYLCGQKPS